MKTADIRRTFLDFFAARQHTIVPTSSLVPANDPTLLFTNAGMVQFKDVFLGHDVRPYKRATTAQRCVRAGGKHNDLDNVGYTARHHTFFEMLGNFSFGDYFKEDAIVYAWELLTEVIGLPKDKLWVTVFEDDDEAADIWLNRIGVPKEKLARIGAHANFWAMGDTGPCGPCSEIFYDHGPEVEGGPPGTPEEDGDRYVEIWNLVFMQFNRDASGAMHPLPKPSVDTGMGLERLAAVLQGVHSNYDIDLFKNLIDAAADRLDIRDRGDKALRVIADHIRSTAFLIVDGVTPSNEGRGYVLRRIIRRAIRHGYQASGEARFMHDLVAPLVVEMGEAYPELVERQAHVERVLRQEGERFSETLDQGLAILDTEIAALKGKRIPGELMFKLYDTYGFPADLTADVAREKGLEVDEAGFEAAMDAQRARARAASHFDAAEQAALSPQPATRFTGYSSLSDEAKVLALVSNNVEVDALTEGEEGFVVLDTSPFYAESGGQVGDVGELRSDTGCFDVTDTQMMPGKVVAHLGKVKQGRVERGSSIRTQVVADKRAATARNHSATHLLHAALQEVVGDHVQQKGSLVLPDRFRFDFSHHEALKPAQLVEIETRVNREIVRNHEVAVKQMPLDDAKAAGAAALFGEKYDEEVRTIRMGPTSFELCGGTHVQRTGDIGMFRITSESGVAAGVRRIEAITGGAAVEWSQAQTALLQRLTSITKSSIDELEPRIKQLNERQRTLEKTVAELQAKLAAGGGGALNGNAVEVAGIKVLTLRQDDMDAKTLRTLMDQLRGKVGEGIVVVGSVREDKASVIAGVSQTLSGQYPAGDLVKQLAQHLGGRGGGKPVLGQGGGPDTDKLDDALSSVPAWIENRANAG